MCHSDKQQTEYHEQMVAYQKAVTAQHASGQGLGPTAPGQGLGPTAPGQGLGPTAPGQGLGEGLGSSAVPLPPAELSTVKKQYRHVLCLYCAGW